MGGGHMRSGSDTVPDLDPDEWKRLDGDMVFRTSMWAYEQQRREGAPDEQVQSQGDEMFGTQDQNDVEEGDDQLPPRNRRPARCGTGGHLLAQHGGRRRILFTTDVGIFLFTTDVGIFLFTTRKNVCK
ncbi:unnamed protein product [Linum trigynum]|uniref:Uncharacterized protein n=1 Tax=Linum trigynum TaxID=586398 RepID=A0AAV2FFS9_9ROSI